MSPNISRLSLQTKYLTAYNKIEITYIHSRTVSLVNQPIRAEMLLQKMKCIVTLPGTASIRPFISNKTAVFLLLII